MLLIEKADQASEGAGRSAQQKAALARLKTEMNMSGMDELVEPPALRADPGRHARGRRAAGEAHDDAA